MPVKPRGEHWADYVVISVGGLAINRLILCMAVIVLPVAAHAEPIFTVSEQTGYFGAFARAETNAWNPEFQTSSWYRDETAKEWQRLPESGPFNGTDADAASVPPAGSPIPGLPGFVSTGGADANVQGYLRYTLTDNSLGYSAGGVAMAHKEAGNGQSSASFWAEIRVRFAIETTVAFRLSAQTDGNADDLGAWQAGFNLRRGWPHDNRGTIVWRGFDHITGPARVLETGVLFPGRYTYSMAGTGGSARSENWWAPGTLSKSGSGSVNFDTLLELLPCEKPVGDLTTEHQAPPRFNENDLDPTLRARVQKFMGFVAAEDGSIQRDISGFRELEYQRHLYEVAGKFQELAKVRGIDPTEIPHPDPQKDPIPQLELGQEPSGCALIAESIMWEVNWELSTHVLRPPVSGPRGVNMPVESMHTNRVDGNPSALAVDMTVNGLSDDKINELVKLAGLKRPFKDSTTREKWHFELGETPTAVGASVTLKSPVNVLVEDPLGRRIGFDPVTGQEVNDFGPGAEYSGAGTEPQFVIFPLGGVLPGDYRVTGVGTGEGPYTISMQTWGEDSQGEFLVDKIIATGFATAGQPIDFVDTELFVLSEPTLLSDLTGNGFVDFEDLTILLANWNKEVGTEAGNLVDADATLVNFADLTVLLADWTGPGPAGSPEAALGAEAVPEPSSLLLALLATLGWSLCMWRRRQRMMS